MGFVRRSFAAAVLTVAGLGCLPAAGAQASPGADTSGAAQAIGYLNQQRQANGIPAFTQTDNSLATSWCPYEDQGPITESRVLSGSSDPLTFTAGSSPWTAAPLHQILMYDPLARSAGWAAMTDASFDGEGTMPYIACMGFGNQAPDPSTPTAYTFFSELGRNAAPASEDVEGEGPFAPQQLAGISQGTPTGPQPIFYLLGMGRVRAVSWSLSDQSSGAAVPGVSLVTSYQAQAAGDDPSIMWNNAVMIPPVLSPGTVYSGQARFTGAGGTCLTESFSFATLQSDGSPLGVSLPAPSTASCSTISVTTSSSSSSSGASVAKPRVKVRWAHHTFVVKSHRAHGERLVVRVHGRVHRTRRATLRMRGRYARKLVAWATRAGHRSARVRVHVRRR